MSKELFNNLRPFLVGGEGAPEYAPEGLLALRGLSVEKLALQIKLTRTALYYYINGVSRPTVPVLRRMCEALEVPYEEGLAYCTPATIGRPRHKEVKDTHLAQGA
jgi:transcriptional regulator with XRE-family HTH domain